MLLYSGRKDFGSGRPNMTTLNIVRENNLSIGRVILKFLPWPQSVHILEQGLTEENFSGRFSGNLI